MEKRNIVNFVNFIRGIEPRKNYSIEEPVFEQIKLHEKTGLKCTFLLQYDALINPTYINILKGLDKDQFEIGVWFEVVQPLVEKIGLKWNGRFPWDWHAHCGFSVGYTVEQRKKLVDELFETFKNTFGYYPFSMGSWAFDSVTAAYADDKYGMKAFCNCKDQWGTDGYTMWGGYYGQGYYPSRMNSFCPAQNDDYQISVPVFRMLGPDPVYQYDHGLNVNNSVSGAKQGVISLEPVYKDAGGGNSKWVDWYLDMNYNNKNLSFSYVQAGQENSFGWDSMKDGYIYQINKIKSMKEQGLLEVEKLCETGDWFRHTFKNTPSSTITALDDWTESGKKSVWYNSKKYRINIFADNNTFKIRDFYVFDEKYAERYRAETCKTDYLQFDNLPVIDGNRFSGNGVHSGGYFYEISDGKKKELTFKDVLYEELGGNAVITFTDTSCGDIEITLSENKLTVLSSDETKKFGIENLISPTAENTPHIEDLCGKNLILSFRGFPYLLKLEQGSWDKNGKAAISENGIIEITLK